MKRKIERLILSGGGMKGISYIGVFKYIDELKKKNKNTINSLKSNEVKNKEDVLKEDEMQSKDNNLTKDVLKEDVLKEDEIQSVVEFNIKEICCVSVGSIVGFLYILGYTYDEFYDEIISTDLNDVKNFKIKSFFTKYGIDNGKKVTDWIIKMIVKKGYSKNMTLRDIWNIFGVNFRVVVSNLNKYEQEIFDYKTNPNLKVIKAIRMAICIPFLFSVEKYRNFVYVDGGLINNFPIKMYGDNLETLLGINIVTKKELDYDVIHEQIDNFNDYLFHVMTCLVVQREKEITLSELYKEHIIYVKTGSITKTIDFCLKEEDKQRLIDIGYETTRDYFERRNQ